MLYGSIWTRDEKDTTNLTDGITEVLQNSLIINYMFRGINLICLMYIKRNVLYGCLARSVCSI